MLLSGSSQIELRFSNSVRLCVIHCDYDRACFVQENGKIVRTGGVELASELEEKGYAGVRA